MSLGLIPGIHSDATIVSIRRHTLAQINSFIASFSRSKIIGISLWTDGSMDRPREASRAMTRKGNSRSLFFSVGSFAVAILAGPPPIHRSIGRLLEVRFGPLGEKVVEGIVGGGRRRGGRGGRRGSRCDLPEKIFARRLGAGGRRCGRAPRGLGEEVLFGAQQQVPELVRQVGRSRFRGAGGHHRRRRRGRRRLRHQAGVDVRQELLEAVVGIQNVPEDPLRKRSHPGGAGRDQLDHPGGAGVQVADHGSHGLVGSDAELRGGSVGRVQHGFQEVHLLPEDGQVAGDLLVGLACAGRRRQRYGRHGLSSSGFYRRRRCEKITGGLAAFGESVPMVRRGYQVRGRGVSCHDRNGFSCLFTK
mmetsp:Transcript_23221/g.54924  ORF Transcript_23221/g.54924 Transcript_23221/m.54924 type:complete len:360 (-) Transcript_23221:156-1235(-)